MIKNYTFDSPLAQQMDHYVSLKQMQGYDFITGARRLKRFDSFLSEKGCHDGVLHMDDMQNYCNEMNDLRVQTQAGHHSCVRQFSLYMHAINPASSVFPCSTLSRHPQNIRCFPLSKEQITCLMQACTIVFGQSAIRADCFRFLIGLLYCTGLRIGEALALNLGDVDTQQATLLVRRGKFKKERLIALSSSAFAALKQWIRKRSAYSDSDEHTAPLLVVDWNRRLSYQQAERGFRKLCQHEDLVGSPAPRLHDLRHNFACHTIEYWRETKQDVNALLPVLANVMGHVDYFSTQTYIHTTAESLRQATDKLSIYRNHKKDY